MTKIYLEVTPKAHNAPLWKAMLKVKHYILNNQRWVVGMGSNLRTFEDIWVPGMAQLKNHLHQFVFMIAGLLDTYWPHGWTTFQPCVRYATHQRRQ